MGLTKQLYDDYVLDSSVKIDYYEKITYIRGITKPKKDIIPLKYGVELVLTIDKKNRD